MKFLGSTLLKDFHINGVEELGDKTTLSLELWSNEFDNGSIEISYQVRLNAGNLSNNGALRLFNYLSQPFFVDMPHIDVLNNLVPKVEIKKNIKL